MKTWIQLIPARVRTAIYLTYGVAAVALGGVAAWYSSVGDAAPSWIAGATAVVVYVGGAFGFVAAGNAGVSPADDPALDLDHDDVDIEDPDTGETYTEIGSYGK